MVHYTSNVTVTVRRGYGHKKYTVQVVQVQIINPASVIEPTTPIGAGLAVASYATFPSLSLEITRNINLFIYNIHFQRF